MKALLRVLSSLAIASLIAYVYVRDKTQSQDKLNFIPAPNSELGWKVVPGSIYDGDTLRVTNGNEELKIRFCGIDAPEKNQPLGIESRDYLRSLLDKGTGEIILVPIEKDKYGRTVAELFMPIGGEEELLLNAEMVRAGLAWHYGKYSGNCPNQDVLIMQESIAKSQGLGVHKAGNVKPEEWRKHKQGK